MRKRHSDLRSLGIPPPKDEYIVAIAIDLKSGFLAILRGNQCIRRDGEIGVLDLRENMLKYIPPKSDYIFCVAQDEQL